MSDDGWYSEHVRKEEYVECRQREKIIYPGNVKWECEDDLGAVCELCMDGMRAHAALTAKCAMEGII